MDVSHMFDRDDCPVVRTSGLSLIARSYTLRCDAKQAESCFEGLERAMAAVDTIQVGSFFPGPFVKGIQPRYLESLQREGVPVVSTLAVQRLRINTDSCRFIAEADFNALAEERKLKPGDVVLTMDGGTSIGKPAFFDMDQEYTVDSHVAILRPEGFEPLALMYLLASPLGQIQFERAESGASGQTAVTEEDVRRFVFPRVEVERLSAMVGDLHRERQLIAEEAAALDRREQAVWDQFTNAILAGSTSKAVSRPTLPSPTDGGTRRPRGEQARRKRTHS